MVNKALYFWAGVVGLLGLITLAKVILDHLENNVAKQTWHMSTCQTSSPIVLDVLVCITFTKHFSSPSYRNQSQTGKSKRSTCHRWWFGEHTEEWRCHPLAHHLGSCPGCCTWDCRNLRTIPELGRLARQIRSQSLGCRSEWGWLPRPPATKALHKKNVTYHNRQKPFKLIGPSVCLK